MTKSLLPLYRQQSCLTGLKNKEGKPDKATVPTLAQQLNIPEQELQDHPWKYLGYRVFSRWTGSEKAFLVVRQFATLNARIILSLQDDISLLEEQLELIEQQYCTLRGEDHENGSFRRDYHTERKILLDKIYTALQKYSKNLF